MKTSHFFAAALLGLATSFSAHAQTPVVGAPGTMSTPGSPATPAAGTGTIVPGQPGTMAPGTMGAGTGMATPGVTAPIGSTGGTLNSNGGVPAGSLNGGTLRTDQPAVPGSQSSRSLNRSRTTTPSRSTTTTRP
jgi:collagen type IV alpha